MREGLDEESLDVFDLLKKPDLSTKEVQRIKTVSVRAIRNFLNNEPHTIGPFPAILILASGARA